MKWNIPLLHYSWRGLKEGSSACMYKKMVQTQSLSQFSNPDADDSHNGFVCYHMPYLLYIIMWEAIFLPDIFSVNWCFVWADGMYIFTLTKGVIPADDYRKWFECIDLTGRITYKMFWPVHVLTHCLNSILSETNLLYSVLKRIWLDLDHQSSSDSYTYCLSFVDKEIGIYWK